MPASLLALLLAQAAVPGAPEPYAPPPRKGSPERLVWNALTNVAQADSAIERWLARNPRAAAPTRLMLAHRLCLDYTRSIVGARRVAACKLELTLDPKGDRSAFDAAQILKDAPPLKVSGTAIVAFEQSPTLRMRSATAKVNGTTLPWFVDAGAGMSVVSESTARRLGVRMLGGGIDGETATSIRIIGGIGLIDRLKIGDAVIRHMPVYILPDAALTFDGQVVPAILGLPALVAFGRVGWLDNGRRLALGRTAPSLRGRLAKLYWHPDGIGIPIRLPRGIAGAQFDSGAGATTLYLPGFALLPPDQTATAVERKVQVSGAGGIETMTLKTLPQVTFDLIGVPIVVDKPNVEKRTDLGAARVGNDMIDQLQTFVIDFTTMTVSIEARR